MSSNYTISLFELATASASQWRVLIGSATFTAAVAVVGALLWPPTYTARTLLMPPQAQQSAAAAALQSLGALAGLAGGAAGVRAPADQYVALMQSRSSQDALVDQFNLAEVYGTKLRVDARRELAMNTRVSVGRKDGLIALEVDDTSPTRAADIANAYVAQLRRLTTVLAVTEAQQRRAFFEKQFLQAKEALSSAQERLQRAGFSEGALRAEPKATAETYARLRAQVTSSEVRLTALRTFLSDSSAEVQQMLATLSALRGQLSRIEQIDSSAGSGEYISLYRDFKYQETLFEIFAKQYEAARVDEMREGAVIQVVDMAMPPERKSSPGVLRFAVVGFSFGLLFSAFYVGLQAYSSRLGLGRVRDLPVFILKG
jgi:uncharacterized protein involved in exopolysaccharide biosynthesis